MRASLQTSLLGLGFLVLLGCNTQEQTQNLRTNESGEEILSPEHFEISAGDEIPESDDKLVIERAPACGSSETVERSDPNTTVEVGIWVIEGDEDPATAFNSENYYALGQLENDGSLSTSTAIAHGYDPATGQMALFSFKKFKIGSLFKKAFTNIANTVKNAWRQPGKVVKKVFAGVISCAKSQVLDKLLPSRDLVSTFLSDKVFKKFLGSDVTQFLSDAPLAVNYQFNGKNITLTMNKTKDGQINIGERALGKIAKDLLNSKDWQSFASKKALGQENGEVVMALQAALKSGSCKDVANLIAKTDSSGTWDAAAKNDYLNTNLACNLIHIGSNGAKFDDVVALAKTNFKKYQKELINRLIRSELFAGINALVPQGWVIGFSSCLADKFLITQGSAVAGGDFNAPLNTALIPMTSSAMLLSSDEGPTAAILTENGFENIDDIQSLFSEPITIQEPVAASCEAPNNGEEEPAPEQPKETKRQRVIKYRT